MKISEPWLRQWVNPNSDTATLAEQLTMAGLEIDGIEAVAKPFSSVVVGEVVSVEPHPDADKLRVTSVNIGADEPLQIVCGAPNVRVGMKAPVATVGAMLPPSEGSDKPFKIKKSKLRGVESQGMLCGASEIDLPDVVDGLLELPEDAPVGKDIRDYLGLDGQILDVAITPNRGDCFSVRGIAREVAVINQMTAEQPAIDLSMLISSDGGKNQVVQVQATEACPRYLAMPMTDIDRTVATPEWMSRALLQSGLRTHNFLVDVTNYVLMELGQPLHAFDADKIVGDIVVRLATAGEKVTLLNDQTVTLIGDELVIADDEGVLALAGIMGGKRSSVTDATTNIVLESAFFAPLAIAGRARRFGLHTDASQRFERGVDFELPERALARAVSLIREIAVGKLGKLTRVETLAELPNREPICLPLTKVRTVLGVDIEPSVIKDILTRLEIAVDEKEGDTWICTPPSHRYDLTLPEDLVEEVARIYGYDNIPNQLPSLSVDMSMDDTADLTHRMRLALVDAGYMEAVSFSFSDAKLEQVLDDEALGAVLPLANPISSDLAVMRRTLLSSLLPCVLYNLNRQQTRVRFFEMGLSFVGKSVSELTQTPSVALVATGDVFNEAPYDNPSMDFFALKGDVEALLLTHGDKDKLTYEPSNWAFLHPGQQAHIKAGKQTIGWLGQLHPSVCKALDLPTTWVAQLALEPLLTIARRHPSVSAPSKFPQVRRDIAMFADEDISVAELSNTIVQAGGDLLMTQWLFDVYQGEHTPDGERSLAFALIWQDPEQTLSDETVNEAMQKVIDALQNEHNVTLRDS